MSVVPSFITRATFPTPTELEERTRAYMIIAAQIMDRHCPDWFDRIDFSRLLMSDADRCIAGQCGLNWSNLTSEFVKETGTCFPHPWAASNTIPYWEEEVAKRKNAPITVTREKERELTLA